LLGRWRRSGHHSQPPPLHALGAPLARTARAVARRHGAGGDRTIGSPGGGMIRTALDRVGIVMMSAVGDAVHVLPVLNALKRHSPSTRTTWVLQPGPATLVRGHPAVDDIVLFDRSRGLHAFTDVRHAL